MERGNRYWSCEYDDLQNWPDTMSHENPLLENQIKQRLTQKTNYIFTSINRTLYR